MSYHNKSRQYSGSSADSYQSYEDSLFSHQSTGSSSTAFSRPDRHDTLYVPTGGGLPCEFVGYHNCDLVFRIDDVEHWIDHIVGEHLEGNLPRKVVCWFCDDFIFDSKQAGDRATNFDNRMYHIREHFYYESKTVGDMRPDHYLNKHLRDNGLIDDQKYNSVRRWSEAPQPAGILSHDAMPPEWQSRDPRGNLAYSDPHAEERSYRRHKHKSGKSRK
ncbi:hypothetical protein GGR55DRAFT_208397 [Xylaria sp. FL0064]|nr:hypothetical protein GGR55DRAFT_208397 [Xylaria sp. FL0064]